MDFSERKRKKRRHGWGGGGIYHDMDIYPTFMLHAGTCEVFHLCSFAKRALKIERQPDTLFVFGIMLHNTNRPEEAERLYTEALQLQPTHYNATVNLVRFARHSMRMKNFDTARTMLRNAYVIDPNT